MSRYAGAPVSAASRELWENMFERSELVFPPDWRLKPVGTRRAASLWSPFLWLLYLGGGAEPKQKKVTSCRATPDQHPRSNNRLIYEQTVID